ncbi:2-oxo acid dehydrogenase subunit E2 [Pseudoramibacter alactolyticus]|mgnify:CR=1 FL=1|uniref:2-oxo acid dehydrogenase subunit E2 n=1 Tax=Pseudoramibacter alactolyticus TaxID=113287 RepID=UPI0023532B09|nr:2-oxo acid dehydrogenase subunit E2 [Pseudoramibacter alactolyticus]MBM6968548.1 2-oxo acid dehydrogenase subunit E2 [Pseudoramibacter alactolyticus]
MKNQKHPEVNCSRVENEIHYYSSINIGVAVGTPTGMLIVPVIKNCESKLLFDISAEMKDIQKQNKKQSIDYGHDARRHVYVEQYWHV